MTTSESPASTARLDDRRAQELRRDFPVLSQEVHGRPLVYLDFGATAQRPRAVLDAERAFLSEHNAAVHRGAHELAALSTGDFEDARATVAEFIGADVDEIAWQSGATDALNTVALGIGAASRGRGGEGSAPLRLGPGDEILITEAEHHANLVPWQELALATGAALRWIPVNERGTWTIDDARALVSPRTRIIAFAHVSNVTGMIAPVAELVELAAAVGAITVLDACQSVPHRPVDVHALGIDFAAFSGHKMAGPNGIGVLYGRRERLAQLPPARTGGSMIEVVAMDGTTFMDPPTRFEAGTQPVSQAVALAEACRYLRAVGMEEIRRHEEAIGARLVRELSAIPGVAVLGDGPDAPRSGLASFAVEGVHSHDVSQFLDAAGIAVRGGHHCAQPLHRRLGLTASTRASSYLTTSDDEIDALLDALRGVRAYFGADR
ncbi:aminotransferase class V-fold PLP-dependent enzyme [Gulosibacter sp. 10]|uniref:aminotransferase class V-fold PLP-dependent enzyme n=1 Tax=Gulosibacter sp. 10 TaxID=1255570 RepID=UPI00097E81B0|nr:SufS family cysteine desulfurase [Gulosibacter sp. 10]SJM70334.1 Cysteine desulfurase, SufS subfamily [Gulosibacter sp. 10]